MGDGVCYVVFTDNPDIDTAGEALSFEVVSIIHVLEFLSNCASSSLHSHDSNRNHSQTRGCLAGSCCKQPGLQSWLFSYGEYRDVIVGSGGLI